MTYLYFDESIRENGQFIIGALIQSNDDLTSLIRREWIEMGLDPTVHEYKSSALKADNVLSQTQRAFLKSLLMQSKLALTVAPIDARRNLGNYCAELVLQLSRTGFLPGNGHVLYIDENIRVSQSDLTRLKMNGVMCQVNTNSSIQAGIQLADHAAHSLGGMLLEEMGIVNKLVSAGEDSGYAPDEILELGFELWAGLRHALIGKNEYIEGLSPPPDDPANPFFRVDGYGLYIAPNCSKKLAEYVRKRFGVNYLGCIH
jgi:hypothetical protein